MKRFFKPIEKGPEGSEGTKRPRLLVGGRLDGPLTKNDDAEGDASPAHSVPLKFVTWNCNGLLVRLKDDNDKRAFKQLIDVERPAIIALQEVRLPAKKEGYGVNRSRMHPGDNRTARDEYALVESTIMQWGYQVALSLANNKSSGVGVMLREDLHPYVRGVRFNLPGEAEAHHPEGRCIIVEFDSFDVINTYVPNNGWEEVSFARRRGWDEKMLAYLMNRTKPVIWLGDLNVSHQRFDVTHPAWFAKQKPDKGPYPEDPEYRGQPGYAPVEQKRFGEMLEKGRLIDSYRYMHPQQGPNDWTWRGGGPRHARFYGKGMRIDYVLVSRELIDSTFVIERAENLGRGIDREGFMGSDHCPLLVSLAMKSVEDVKVEGTALVPEKGADVPGEGSVSGESHHAQV